MSNVKCVKSEALAMIKGWSYLSKGAILVASSTCGKNTNIKRNAKAKASVTFKRLIKQRFNTSKLVAAIQRDRPKPSSSSTLCVCVIFFIDHDHQNHLQCQYPQIRNNQSSGSKSDQAKSLTPVQVGDLQPKQHYLGDCHHHHQNMTLSEKINKLYIILPQQREQW